MKDDDRQITSISKARTLEEIAEFWDTHSIADYEDQIYEVEFEVKVERRRWVPVTREMYHRIENEAQKRGVAAEKLVNAWLEDCLQQAR
jgi:hypothetical protein